MQNIHPVLKKVLRISAKVLGIFLIVMVVLYLAAYIYITSNKKKLIAQVTQSISEKMDGKVTVGDADISLLGSFPKLSVVLKDVMVTDTMYAQHKHAFFTAKELYFTVSAMKLIRKQPPLNGLRIKNGSVYLYTDTSGYSNTYLLKSKKDSSGGPKKTTADINLENVRLENVRITLQDLKREKFHDFEVKDLRIVLTETAEILTMQTDASIVVNSLAFNLPRGTFLKGVPFVSDFRMNYGKVSQQLSFENIDVRLAGQKYVLTGSFDLGDKNPAFNLKVKVNQVLYNDVKKLLPKRIDSSLSMVALDKPLDAEAELYGPLRGGEPFILAKWTVKKSKLNTQFLDFDDASFTGFYKNEVVKGLPRNDPNSVISVSNLTASWHGLPVTSNKIQILNLATPELTCDLHSAFQLTALNELIQTNSLQLTSGTAAMELNYKGPVAKNDNTNSFLNGNILFKNGTILYAPRNVELKELNGVLRFNNSNVFIENIQTIVLNNKIVMNGSANNLLTLISTDPNRVKIDFNIFSPSLNLGAFTYLLQSRKKTTANANNKGFGKMAGQIDALLEQSRIDVSLKANELIYKKFNANNLDANVSLLQDRYLLNNVSMNLAGGRMDMKGQLVTVSNTLHNANVDANLVNVDVKKLFTAFNNFGQDGITAQSLEGSLTSQAAVNIAITDAGAVVPSSANGTVNFSLKNGALNNYEPIKKIQNFIFKKRDFDNIRFAELKDKLVINRGEITINRMEIQSSVLTMFVEGLFSQKGNTDISIQVPLNNLKKRDEDYNPENIGTKAKVGRSVFLRGQNGSDGNVKFKLDLFNRYKKDNN